MGHQITGTERMSTLKTNAKPHRGRSIAQETAMADAMMPALPAPTTNAGEMGRTEMVVAQRARADMLNRAWQLTANLGASDLVRTSFLKFLLDGPRDIDGECGYPSTLTPDHYRAMYDREGIAGRVVDCKPDASWDDDPDVYEDEDEKTETEFESAWDDLVKAFNIYHWLHRIDVISGIGQFGILLFGINDGKELSEPVDGFNDDGTVDAGNEYELQYIRVFSEEVTYVHLRESDTKNPRYGLPRMYRIQFRDLPNWSGAGEIFTREVHWSRVIHVADNRKMSEVFGIPRMQKVYNRLYDCRKMYAAAGEAFWKGAFPGLAFEINPDVADQGIEIDKESIKKEFEDFQNGTQRYLAVEGVTTKTLPPMVVDPTPSVETELKAIAISLDIPYRILFGSEEAKLAGGQDSDKWKKQVKRRQNKYVTAMIIRPFVDRMIGYGVLPPPAETNDYTVEWPDLNTPSDADKATVALTRTQAIQAYTMGGASQLIPPQLFLTLVMGFTSEESDAILDGADDFNAENDLDDGENDDETETGQGSMGGADQTDGGDALAQDNLNRTTTAPPGVKQMDPPYVQMPSLNAEQASALATVFQIPGLTANQRNDMVDVLANMWSDEARAASAVARRARMLGKTGSIKTARGMVGAPGEPAGTLADHTDENGKIDAERLQMHDLIVKHALRGSKPVTHPAVLMMGGGSASGKSSVIAAGHIKSANHVTVDSDALKEHIPEYKTMKKSGDVHAAAYSHEESSHLAKRVLKTALHNKSNVLMDGTGDSSFESLKKKVDSWRAAGAHRVDAEYVTAPTDVAVKRAQLRAAKTGRHVHESTIRGIHQNVSKILPVALKNKLFDHARLWDTHSVDAAGKAIPNAKPVLVMEHKNGKTVIHDHPRWQSFLAKSNPGG